MPLCGFDIRDLPEPDVGLLTDCLLESSLQILGSGLLSSARMQSAVLAANRIGWWPCYLTPKHQVQSRYHSRDCRPAHHHNALRHATPDPSSSVMTKQKYMWTTWSIIMPYGSLFILAYVIPSSSSSSSFDQTMNNF